MSPIRVCKAAMRAGMLTDDCLQAQLNFAQWNGDCLQTQASQNSLSDAFLAAHSRMFLTAQKARHICFFFSAGRPPLRMSISAMR